MWRVPAVVLFDMTSQESVLSAFDDLIESGADLTTLVKQAASLAGCVAGVRTAAGVVVTAGPDGLLDQVGPCAEARTRVLRDGSEAWLAATGDSRSAPDDVVLRRFGIAVTVAVLQDASHGRAADISAIVDPMASDEDRLPSLRRLGLHGTTPITLVAFAGPPAGIDRAVEHLRGLAPVVHHARDGRVHLVIARDLDGVDELIVPVGVWCAYAPARPPLRAPEAWREARNALRFALPSTHDVGPYPASEAVIVDSASLGGYAILAEQLTAEEIAQVVDVQRLEQLHREHGPSMLTTLLAVAATDSLRKAAKTVHLHHNSVAHRVERAEKVLGFGCTEPFGRARLLLTLTLHRLLESHKAF